VDLSLPQPLAAKLATRVNARRYRPRLLGELRAEGREPLTVMRCFIVE
jgi:hypothetical protein